MLARSIVTTPNFLVLNWKGLDMLRFAFAMLAVSFVFAPTGRTVAQEDAPPKMPAPEGAKVYFAAPLDGETVSSPFLVRFGLTGMGVAPSGIEYENTGHHHIVVDRETPPLDFYLPTAEDWLLHFGGGQTEATVELAPGEHTLQLILGDQDHLPHDPPVISETITITVE